MIFGPIAVERAAGAILAHTTRAGDRVLKKGRVLSEADAAALAAAGLREIVGARLEPGELDEHAAAAAIAAAIAGAGLTLDHTHTGRSNLHAAAAGVIELDRAALAAANDVDEGITVATVAPYTAARAGDLVATVKIIPFAVPAAAAAAAAEAARGAVALRPWRGCRGALILTRFADTAERVLERAAAAQRTRLERCGAKLASEVRVPHDTAAVAGAITDAAAAGMDPILVLGASAIVDRRDVIPAALERAGGAIVRLGMPVDPGNLLLLGRLRGTTVLGVPGCARSLKRSGFDAVLERACAGVPVVAQDLAAMGIGGLLDEVSVRPQPRAGDAGGDPGDPAHGAAAAPGSTPGSATSPASGHAVRIADERRVAAIVLAAGRASRMGANKLLAELDGVAIVRRTVAAALASRARPVVVVTGHEAAAVREALADLDVTFAHNPSYAEGMSTSLRAGLAAIGPASAALVCLGDMPRLLPHHLDAVIAAHKDDETIVVPTFDHKRGNPVLWPRRYFAEMAALTGDVGARALIDRYADQVAFLPTDDPAILVDVDTPAALAALRNEHA
jgi:molybdenum cofactor cytidylyltransferase